MDAARSLLGLKLADPDRVRVNELVGNACERSLSEEERCELNEYERVASLLELLQSKARLSLEFAESGSTSRTGIDAPPTWQPITVPDTFSASGLQRAVPHFGIDVAMNKHYRDLNAYVCFPPLV